MFSDSHRAASVTSDGEVLTQFSALNDETKNAASMELLKSTTAEKKRNCTKAGLRQWLVKKRASIKQYNACVQKEKKEGRGKEKCSDKGFKAARKLRRLNC